MGGGGTFDIMSPLENLWGGGGGDVSPCPPTDAYLANSKLETLLHMYLNPQLKFNQTQISRHVDFNSHDLI